MSKDRLLSTLSSLHLTWWVLIGFILWFALGIQAEKWPSFQEGLAGMNALLVRDWLGSQAQQHPLTLIWLMGLIVLALVLGINLVVCIWKRWTRNANGRGLRFWIFLLVHMIFALVMLMHGLETVVGQKYPQQTVAAGERISLGQGWAVQVDSITYVDDPQLLLLDKHQARRAMSRDRFDMQVNSVRVNLMHHGRQVKQGTLRMLDPVHAGRVHVVLRGFAVGPEEILAKLRVVISPLHTVFFSAYALLILSLMLCLVLRLGQQRP